MRVPLFMCHLAAALGAVSAPEASALARCRVAVVVDEHVAKERVDTTRVGAAVAKRLASRSDVFLVDLEQSRRARSALGEDLSADSHAKLIKSLRADLLIVGSAWLDEAEDTVLKIKAYDASASIKLVTSDSARILAFEDAKATGSHHTLNHAMRRTTDRLGMDIYTSLMSRLDEACSGGDNVDRVVEVLAHLHGPVGPRTTGKVVRAIRGISGVKDVEVTDQDKRSIWLDVTTSLGSLELAEFIDRTGRGVRIHSWTRRQVEADFVMGDVLSVDLVSRTFTGAKASKKARHKVLATEIPSQILLGLGSLEMVNLPAPDRFISAKQAKRRKAGRIILEGSYRPTREGIRVSMSLRAAASQREIFSDKRMCPSDTISACVAQLSAEARISLPRLVEAHQQELKVKGSPPPAPPAHLQIDLASTFDGVYPSLVRYYDAKPAGRLKIKNRSRAALESLELKVELRGYSKEPTLISLKTLDRRSAQDVDLQLDLDAGKLLGTTENLLASLRVQARYEVKGDSFILSEEIQVPVFERAAHRWKKDEAKPIAAFVTHQTERVDVLVGEAQAAIEGKSNDPLAKPLALFQAMAGLKYQRDSVNPVDPDELDRVLYPDVTLTRGRGDCDDLAVLYASLLEGSGVEAELVQFSGHVFAMAKLPVSPTAAGGISDDMSRFVIRKGDVWLPVETTKVGSSFEEAWALAAEELRSAKRRGATPRYINVRSAWRSGYWPQAPEVRGVSKTEVNPRYVRRDLAAYAELRTRRIAEATADLAQAKVPADFNRAGVKLARLGQFGVAAEAFEQGAKGTRSPTVLNNLGNVRLLTEEIKEAMTYYRDALGIAPEDGRIRYNAVITAHVLASVQPSDAHRREAEQHVEKLCLLDSSLCEQMLERVYGRPVTAGDIRMDLAALRTQLEDALGRPMKEAATTATEIVVGDMHISEHLHWLN